MKRSDTILAGGLPRSGIHQMCSPTWFATEDFADAQRDGKKLIYHGLWLSFPPMQKYLPLPAKDGLVVFGMPIGRTRPLEPGSRRKLGFTKLHSIYHPGVHAFIKPISDWYISPVLTSDIHVWEKVCIPYQRSKVTRKFNSLLPKRFLKTGAFLTSI